MGRRERVIMKSEGGGADNEMERREILIMVWGGKTRD